MKEKSCPNAGKKQLPPKKGGVPEKLSPFTPKERNALWLVAGLFLVGWLVRACRTHGGF